MGTTVFDELRGRWADKAAAWDLGQRPVPQRCSDARVLDPDTAIVALCEPKDYQQLSRVWHRRNTVHDLDEALHQLELERAAQPPVIEVTVTAPPGGIARPELARLVCDQVAEFASRKVLTATRRARDYLLGDPLDRLPSYLPPAEPWVPEDDTPTGPIPVVREVQVP